MRLSLILALAAALSAQSVVPWYDNGYRADGVMRWRDDGINDSKILHWQDGGISDSKVLQYRDDGINAPPITGVTTLVVEGGAQGSADLRAAQSWSPTREPITLRWCVETLPASPSSAEVRGAINEALREWAKYVEIRFRPGPCGGERTLTFTWATGDHGCGWPFVPESMAHAYWPPPWSDEPKAGDVHFNAAREWTPADIYRVALHEIGHALGVTDSNVWYSAMRYEGTATWLQASDIAAVRRLYGRRCHEIECAMRFEE